MEIICAGSLTVLELGKRGSNQTRAIRFDIAEWMADYPDGSVHILHKRPGEETPLPVSNTEKTDTYIDWVIEQADVANEGYGECELVMMDTISHTAKSVTYMTHIGTPISSSDETVPEPHQGWVDSVLQAATDAEAAKNAAVDAQTAAETAQSAAEDAQTAAEKAQDTAENAKASAVMSSNAAYNYAADANRAKRDSVNAKNDAVQAKTDAENAQEAAENAEESANTSALKSEGYAVGTQNGTPAGSGEPYYQDNAKYYKEQAAAAKTAAETARDTAQQTVAGIEAAGTAQVGRVAAEGATQVTNVQTKGQQVLDSIPSDYSQLSGNVDELKSAISEVKDVAFIVEDTESAEAHIELGMLQKEITITQSEVVPDFGCGYVPEANGLTELIGRTKNGITSTKIGKCSLFKMSGTLEGATKNIFDADGFKLANGMEVTAGDVVTVLAISSVPGAGVSVRGYHDGYTNETYVTLTMTNANTIYRGTKTVQYTPASGRPHRVILYAPENNYIFGENDYYWVGFFKGDVSVESCLAGEAISIASSIQRVDSLWNESVVTRTVKTKDYVDQLDVDINDKLTYVTPEKFYGGIIPSNVDASTYINQAISYAVENGIPVYCLGTYTTQQPIEINNPDMLIRINKITYSGSGEYAIRIRKQRVNLQIKTLNSSADGIQLAGDASTYDASHNIVAVDYAYCTKDCIHIVSLNGTALVSGRNSYNTITVKRGTSTTKSIINIDTGCGSAENRIYGGYVRTDADYAIKVMYGGGQVFHNFMLEADAFSGVLVYGGCTLVDFRTAELENHLKPSEPDRRCIKLVRYGTVAFSRRYPHPKSIDVSEVEIPPESYQEGESGWMYGRMVRSAIVRVDSYNNGLSEYNMDATLYNCICGGYAYNRAGTLICKNPGDKSIDIDSATVDMNRKDQVNHLNILADSQILLSPSYCADGISELYIDQTNGYTATITDAYEHVVFNGANYGAGIYKIRFIAQKVPFRPREEDQSIVYYTYFYGRNSKAIVERVDVAAAST